MRCNLENIKELPSRPHPFFLAPKRNIELEIPSDNSRKTVLHYREAGKGAPILLLHGLWSTGYTFRYLLSELSRSNRVIVLELFHPQDNGRPPRVDYAPAYLKELYWSLCRSLELEKPLLVAQAEGGLGALLLAMEHPEALLGVITLDTCMQLTLASKLRGKWLQIGWIRNRWTKKNYTQPQHAACSMLEYDLPALASRQEIRQLAFRWASFPQAQATSAILAQSLTPAYRQAFLHKLTQYLSSSDGFSVPIKVVLGKTTGCLPKKTREKLLQSNKNIDILDPPHGCGCIQVEASDWLCKLIASML